MLGKRHVLTRYVSAYRYFEPVVRIFCVLSLTSLGGIVSLRRSLPSLPPFSSFPLPFLRLVHFTDILHCIDGRTDVAWRQCCGGATVSQHCVSSDGREGNLGEGTKRARREIVTEGHLGLGRKTSSLGLLERTDGVWVGFFPPVPACHPCSACVSSLHRGAVR